MTTHPLLTTTTTPRASDVSQLLQLFGEHGFDKWISGASGDALALTELLRAIMGSTNPGGAPSTPVRKAPIVVGEDEDDSRVGGGGGNGGDEDEVLDVSTASAAAPEHAATGTPPRSAAQSEPVASGAASLSKASIDQLHKAW